MSCPNCHKKVCGCKDQAFTTIPIFPCPDTCPAPEPCSEIIDANCVSYTGPSILDLGINTGDRLNLVMQKLILLATNPGCVTPGSACLSTFNLVLNSSTSTTLTPGWALSTTAVLYQVEYKVATSLIWTLRTAVGPTITQDIITGLLPDTEYHIRVNSICALGNCYSITLLVSTTT